MSIPRLTGFDCVSRILLNNIKPFLDSQWEQQTECPVGLIGISIKLIDSINKAIPLTGLPPLPTPLEMLSGSCCQTQQVYTLAQHSLIGTSGVGGMTAILLLISGLPATSAITALLSVGTLAGAYFAHEAATQQRLAESVEDLRRQTQSLQANNQALAHQTTLFNLENSELRTNIENLNNQNAALKNNLDNMGIQLSQFALHNQHYLTIATEFREFIEQFRRDASTGQERLAKQLEVFIQQISGSQELWANFSSQATIFQENYSSQLEQLRALITQLIDPQATLLRLQEHREINGQIQAAVIKLERYQQDLSQLNAQIAIREGQLKERDELLTQLKMSHQEIISTYQEQNAELGQNNSTLDREIDRISDLIDQHFSPSVETTVQAPVLPGYTLGIRKGFSWSKTVPFTPLRGKWLGHIPINREFKFILTSEGGEILWEKGSNRIILNPSLSQREIDGRMAVF